MEYKKYTYPQLPYDEQKYGKKLNSHISAKWTYPDHWAHDNYQRSHLPQLCIIASGWKAWILAILFNAKKLN